MRGQVNGWASKPFGLLMLPVINVMLYLFMRFQRKFDRKLSAAPDGGESHVQRPMRILRLALVAFFFGVICFQMAAALGYQVPMGRFVFTGCLLLFVVIGNYFTVLRPNYFVGIRTPWTLRNPLTWRATHRIGGRIMVFGSLALLAAQFFIAQQVFTWAFLAFLFGFLLWALVYSWNHSRTHAASC